MVWWQFQKWNPENLVLHVKLATLPHSFSKQSQFLVQDVSLVWKAYFESLLKIWSLGWLQDKCYWPFLDWIFIKQAQRIFSLTLSNLATRIVVGCSVVAALVFMLSVCINKLKNTYFEQMGECLYVSKQDRKFTGAEFWITVRQAWKYHSSSWQSNIFTHFLHNIWSFLCKKLVFF